MLNHEHEQGESTRLPVAARMANTSSIVCDMPALSVTLQEMPFSWVDACIDSLPSDCKLHPRSGTSNNGLPRCWSPVTWADGIDPPPKIRACAIQPWPAQ